MGRWAAEAAIAGAYARTMRNRSVIAGLVLFGTEILITLLVLSRLVFDAAPVLPVLWFLAMLSGVGFAMLLGWWWVQSRRRRRAVRQAAYGPRD